MYLKSIEENDSIIGFKIQAVTRGECFSLFDFIHNLFEELAFLKIDNDKIIINSGKEESEVDFKGIIDDLVVISERIRDENFLVTAKLYSSDWCGLYVVHFYFKGMNDIDVFECRHCTARSNGVWCGHLKNS